MIGATRSDILNRVAQKIFGKWVAPGQPKDTKGHRQPSPNGRTPHPRVTPANSTYVESETRTSTAEISHAQAARNAFMQVQTIIPDTGTSREFPYFCTLIVALRPELRNSSSDLGVRPGYPSRGGTSPAPHPQTQTPVTWGNDVTAKRHRANSKVGKLPCQHKRIAGEVRLSSGPEVSVDSRECSPTKNSPSSSPYSSAHVPLRWRLLSPRTRSRPAMSSSSGPAPTRTGKVLSSWFAVFVQMALSVARSYGRIAAGMLWRGIRIAPRQSSKSGRRPSLNLRCASAHGATTDPQRVYIILSANRLDVRHEQPIGKQPNRQVVGFTVFVIGTELRPDNEYYVAPCRSP
jgi:hypothetical protein